MGYIVDLTVILDDILRTIAGSVSVDDVQSALVRHIDSGRRDRIHRDIRRCVINPSAIEVTEVTVQETDLVLRNIVDLIRQYCDSPLSENG
jgi:hypothetical protein